ncbi:hypothetical protein J2T14_006247 [Paenibacillus harenae]|nr:hypothetical protein [Paenibacillus harenae]
MDENFTTWTEYFIVNKQSLKPIYWDDPYKLDPQEYATIARSIQQFQIGESSEGKYLIEIPIRRFEAVRQETIERHQPSHPL